MLVVVSYDVRTCEPGGAKRLRKVAKLCQNRGVRVQFSVFECLVDPAQWEVLRVRLMEAIDPEQDSLRFYFLGANWERRVEFSGVRKDYDQAGPLVI
jgi:CRISPR-associated protein Cas2